MDDLLPLFQQHEWFTLLLIQGEESRVWRVNAVESHLLKYFKTDLPNHHRRGGQSQNRLMRIREQHHEAYLNFILEWVRQSVKKEDKVILCGYGTKVEQVKQRLLEMEYHVAGFFSVDDRAPDVVKRAQILIAEEQAYGPERELWERYFQRDWEALKRGLDSRLIYGLEPLQNAIDQGMLERCLVHPSAFPPATVQGLRQQCQERDIMFDLVQDPNHSILRLGCPCVGLVYFAGQAEVC